MILAIVMPTEVLVLTFDIDLSTCLRAADGSSELFTPTSIPDVGLRRFELDTWDPVSGQYLDRFRKPYHIGLLPTQM